MSESWIEQLQTGWNLLKEESPQLDVERFFRHALTAFRSRAMDAQALAVIATRMLASGLKGAPYLGRKMLEQAGTAANPPIGVAYALALLTEKGGPADLQLAHQEFERIAYQEDASRDLRGFSFAALGDSYRTGRGLPVDISAAKKLYEKSEELGCAAAAYSLGLYWEGRLGEAAPEDTLPNLTEAARHYRAGASRDPRCAERLEIVRANLENSRRR